MRMVSRARVLALAGTLSLCGCVTNPVTGQREISVLSPQDEAQAGEQGAAQVEATMGLVEDAALSGYVRAIGERLAAHSPRKDTSYRFHVVDDPTPNAFALPGGYIYVTRGLLALTNSEDELAGVIGHEIGHVAARHAAQRQTRATGVGLLAALGTLAGGVLAGEGGARTAAQLGQVAGAGYIASYSRDQERQADEVGQRLAAEAGYAPDGISHFLRTLQREEQLRSGKQRAPGFLDSHPATGERVEATLARARSLSRTPQPAISPDPASFLARFDGLLVGPDPAEGVFVENRFLHPGMDLSIEFPKGWRTQNQPQAVLAAPGGGGALLQLETQGGAGDPARAAQQFLQQNGLQAQQVRGRQIGGFPAYQVRAQAQGQQGPLGLDITWIAHPRGMLRLLGVAPLQSFSTYADEFDDVAGSFRTLSPQERAQIRELRLRIARAQRGDTLSELGRREQNRWSPDETAVANGLAAPGQLTAGKPIKVAVERPYR